MPITLNRPSFAAGELDPMFAGRVDVDKYMVGCRTCENMVVHPQGGASRRQGTIMAGAALGDGRLIPFIWNSTQSYVLVFTDGHLQVVRDNGFIANCLDLVDAARWKWTYKEIESADWYYLTAADDTDPGVSEPTAVRLNEVAVTPTTGWVYDDPDTLGYSTIRVQTSTDPDTLTFGAYTAVYAGNLDVTSPFALADLQDLTYVQSADTVFFAHPSYAPVKLVRYSHYAWRFVTIAFRPKVMAPGGLAASYTGSAASPTRDMRYAVSAILEDGDESVMSDQVSATVDSPWESGAVVDLSWNEIEDSVSYSVWKNSRGTWGLIGSTSVALDTGKVAGTPISGGDYSSYAATKAFDGDTTNRWRSLQSSTSVDGAAYIGLDLGAAKAIISFRILQESGRGVTSVDVEHSPDGTTWTLLETVTLDPTKGDWEEFTINSAETSKQYWRLLAASDAEGLGHWSVHELEFHARTFGLTFVDDNINPDTGMAPLLEANPFDGEGNYPGAVGLFQQRLWYGGTDTKPTTIWASRSGVLENFSSSTPLRDDDAIEATLTSRRVDRIRHLIPLRDMAILTAGSEWRLVPGQKGAVTPTDMALTPQGYSGSGRLAPLAINGAVLYLTRPGTEVRDLEYQFTADGYQGSSMTILAGHLFRGQDTPGLRDWGFCQYPDHVVWAVREDGTLVALTYVKEHDVWAWHRHELAVGNGTSAARSLCVLPDDGAEGADLVYVLTKRVMGDSTVYWVEAILPENAWRVYLDGASIWTEGVDPDFTSAEAGFTIPARTDYSSSVTLGITMLDEAGDPIEVEASELSLQVELWNGKVWSEAPSGTLTDHATGLFPDLTTGWTDGVWSITADIDASTDYTQARITLLVRDVILATTLVDLEASSDSNIRGIRERQEACGMEVWAEGISKTFEQCKAEVNALAPFFVDSFVPGADLPTMYDDTYADGATTAAELYLLICALTTTMLDGDAADSAYIAELEGEAFSSSTPPALPSYEYAYTAAVGDASTEPTSFQGFFWDMKSFVAKTCTAQCNVSYKTWQVLVRVPTIDIGFTATVYQKFADKGATYGTYDPNLIPGAGTSGHYGSVASLDTTDFTTLTAWTDPIGVAPAFSIIDAALPDWPTQTKGHCGGPEDTFALVEWDFTDLAGSNATTTTVALMYTAVSIHQDGDAIDVVHADGTFEEDVTVISGYVTVTHEPADWLVMGYSYLGILETMELDYPAGYGQTAQGKKKRIAAVSVRMFQSPEFWWGPDEDTQAGPQLTGQGYWRDTFPGDYVTHRVAFPGGWAMHGRVCLTFPHPYPATVLEIIPEVTSG